MKRNRSASHRCSELRANCYAAAISRRPRDRSGSLSAVSRWAVGGSLMPKDTRAELQGITRALGEEKRLDFGLAGRAKFDAIPRAGFTGA